MVKDAEMYKLFFTISFLTVMFPISFVVINKHLFEKKKIRLKHLLSFKYFKILLNTDHKAILFIISFGNGSFSKIQKLSKNYDT